MRRLSSLTLIAALVAAFSMVSPAVSVAAGGCTLETWTDALPTAASAVAASEGDRVFSAGTFIGDAQVRFDLYYEGTLFETQSFTADSTGYVAVSVDFVEGDGGTWTLNAAVEATECAASVTIYVMGDTAGHPFETDIEWLRQSGITTGCSPTDFCPDLAVERGQMAAFLVRALELPAATADYFTDDETSIFEDDINRLAESNITTGCTATLFCPTHFVTREQMAAFLVRAFVLPATTTDFFTDDEGSIFEDDINRLAAKGITSGCTATTYCPHNLVSRGQMAAFLRRALTP